MPETTEKIAQALWEARTSGHTIAPPSHEHGLDDVDIAYRIQVHNRDRREQAGDRAIGRKVGLTSPAAQAQFGVESPALGTLWASTRFASGAAIPLHGRSGVRVEAEIALVLGADIPDSEVDDAELLKAVRGARAALEIVDSRITDWQVTLADLVADNTAGWGCVIGDTELKLGDFDLLAAQMQMRRNGEVASEGTATAVMGNPLHALRWAAGKAIELGLPLAAGEIILTGALGPVVAAAPGAEFRAEITGFPPVSVAFTAS